MKKTWIRSVKQWLLCNGSLWKLANWQCLGLFLGALFLLGGCVRASAKNKSATPQSSVVLATPRRSSPQAARVKIPENSVKDLKQLDWSWQPKALHLSITADGDLNRYDEQPHAIMLCLYQLSSVNAWSELIKSVNGIDTLLKCDGFDRSVVQSERLFIQPGQQKQLVLDRLEKGRYVALVAGYAAAKAQRLSPIFQFPVKHAKKGVLFWRKNHYWPGDLFLNLVLTEQALQGSEII